MIEDAVADRARHCVVPQSCAPPLRGAVQPAIKPSIDVLVKIGGWTKDDLIVPGTEISGLS